ncbi:MAG: copper chaperone PCu(A)C [Acidimicrobiales bacterium]|nr:copper chaperone PCu(A)C [Acidimicrobiales bacterium]
MIRNKRIAVAFVAVSLGAATAACSSGNKQEAATSGTSAVPATTAARTGTTVATGIEVTDAWARTSPMNAKNGAVYMKLTSAGEDRLVGASVAPTIAAKVELHETVMADMSGSSTTMGMGADTSTTMGMMAENTSSTMGMGSSMNEGEGAGGSTMQMKPVDAIELPAGKTVELKPGGLHVMLIDLTKPLETGSSFELTLRFEKAGTKTVTVTVKEG